MCNRNSMHPRNVFITPPDYTELAIKYQEFRKLCKLALNGKVILNLKNEEALRGLTKTLLLHYFDLKVEFAPNSLIPTLPSRLNYILWIEDIMSSFEASNIHGIDVGCGSSCVYALLAAKKNNWKMSALEANATNIQYARDNIERNQLEHSVSLFPQTDKNVILSDFLKSTTTPAFDFCLCNPPFFDLNNSQGKSYRKPETRKEPNNCQTGNVDELYCKGGEVAFVERMISESIQYANRVKVFSTLLGHKNSVSLIADFLKTKNIKNIVTTEFCQGNTTRWGIAWSFEVQLLKDEKLKSNNN